MHFCLLPEGRHRRRNSLECVEKLDIENKYSSPIERDDVSERDSTSKAREDYVRGRILHSAIVLSMCLYGVSVRFRGRYFDCGRQRGVYAKGRNVKNLAGETFNAPGSLPETLLFIRADDKAALIAFRCSVEGPLKTWQSKPAPSHLHNNFVNCVRGRDSRSLKPTVNSETSRLN
ncbi:hypothetical protein EVAR_82296_1 [Eumeta japonica]|uniref:Uncharacterized protein n=1 Tax=Eumeta variegata TaxID=151549 RepID=A0A4C1W129_EUMVA|nr:hypothetical protein EVAR_82296_1 [Eumeta japonica]